MATFSPPQPPSLIPNWNITDNRLRNGNESELAQVGDLRCSLTHKILVDPVLASDGYTYEREALENYLATHASQASSPFTGEILDPKVVIPNRCIGRLLLPAVADTITHKVPQDLNCRIPADLADLDRLHAIYSWIPDSTCVRPTPETLARKNLFFETVMPQYETETDFVLHNIFGMDVERSEISNKLVVSHPHSVLVMRPHSLRRTVQNLFPYNVPAGTLHFVHWCYPHFALTCEIDEEKTNDAIKIDLSTHFGFGTKFQFVWNINPKMSLPHHKTGCMHVHVFVKLF